jgi:hypothetical protein
MVSVKTLDILALTIVQTRKVATDLSHKRKRPRKIPMKYTLTSRSSAVAPIVQSICAVWLCVCSLGQSVPDDSSLKAQAVPFAPLQAKIVNSLAQVASQAI